MNVTNVTPEISSEYEKISKLTFSDYVIAGVACVIISLFFMLFTPGLLHWFLIPTVFCGIIIGADAVAWLRRKYDPFDIKGLIGIFGFHFFFIAPLIYLYLDLEPTYIANPDDWRPWFGYLGFINIVGLVCYKLFQRIGFAGVSRNNRMWCMNPSRTWFVLNSAIVLAILGQLIVFIRMGGIRGIMQARFEGESAVFSGMGSFRILGVALPLLCFIALTLYIHANRISIRGYIPILFTLAVFGLFQLYVAGGFTSRGLILTSLFWVLGIIHYFWRALPHKFLILLIIPALFFLWIYSFYKALGPRLFEKSQGRFSVSDLAQETGRTFGGMLVGDLSRVNIQSYILFVQYGNSFEYDLRYGKTYLGSFSPVVPRWIWRSKPAHAEKIRAGTELIYGKHYYEPTKYGYSKRAYGLAGEAMLNFGFWGVPFAYAIWGFLIGRFRRYVNSFEAGDLRFFLVPYVIWFFINMLPWDMDNYIAHTVMRAAFPLIIIYLMAEKCARFTESIYESDGGAGESVL